MAEGPRIYNLFPLLCGSIRQWEDHLPRIAAMGFDWVYVNPFHYPGQRQCITRNRPTIHRSRCITASRYASSSDPSMSFRTVTTAVTGGIITVTGTGMMAAGIIVAKS